MLRIRVSSTALLVATAGGIKSAAGNGIGFRFGDGQHDCCRIFDRLRVGVGNRIRVASAMRRALVRPPGQGLHRVRAAASPLRPGTASGSGNATG